MDGRAVPTRFMKDAAFIIPNPALLDKGVYMIDAIPMKDRDTKGDLYENMLSKITTAGQNGQLCTPRHIIEMVNLCFSFLFSGSHHIDLQLLSWHQNIKLICPSHNACNVLI